MYIRYPLATPLIIVHELLGGCDPLFETTVLDEQTYTLTGNGCDKSHPRVSACNTGQCEVFRIVLVLGRRSLCNKNT